MADLILDNIEIASPYIACAVVFFALGAGVILYLDRGYKQHIQCASCRKKMFSTSQDVPLSDVKVQQRLEKFRYLVQSGQVSEDIH